MYSEKSPLVDKTVPKPITIAQQIAAETIETQIKTQKRNQYLAALIGRLTIATAFFKNKLFIWYDY